MKTIEMMLPSAMALFVVVTVVGCGDSSSPCSASTVQPSECGPKSANGVSWGGLGT